MYLGPQAIEEINYQKSIAITRTQHVYLELILLRSMEREASILIEHTKLPSTGLLSSLAWAGARVDTANSIKVRKEIVD